MSRREVFYVPFSSIYIHRPDLHLLLESRRTNLALQEPGRRARSIGIVRKVSCGNVKRTKAYEIASGTVHLQVRLRVALDCAAVLVIPGVAKENDALDLLADGVRELGDSAGHDGSSLAI